MPAHCLHAARGLHASPATDESLCTACVACMPCMLSATAHFLPNTGARSDAPEVETVEEFLAQEGLNQAQAPEALDVLVPVPDLANLAGEIWTQLRGARPGEVWPAAGGACRPPNEKSTASSSGGPPGVRPTRSRVTNSAMWIRPMARLPMKWDVSVAEIDCERRADPSLQRPLASCVTALRGASVTPSRGGGPCPRFTPPGRDGAPARSL